MSLEDWFLVIKDYPRYSVNQLGSVKGPKGILRPVKNSNGYLYVSLYNDKGCTRKQIHRLVAETFIPNPDNKPNVDHIDRDPFNNRVDNLRWCTQSENLLNPLTIAYRSLMIGDRRAVDIAFDNGIPKETFYRRMRQGWSLSEASVVPPKCYTSKKRKLKMDKMNSTEGRVVPSV